MDEHDPFGLVGQTLDGQFRVDKYVGEGGFSVVYKGHHIGLDAPVALKCLKLPSALQASLVDSFVQRFRDESRLYYQLSQGNLSIVRSISSGTTTIPATGAVLPYMVLEWLEGRSLAQDFDERRAKGLEGRTLEDAFELFSGAADGLGYAHAQGVVHRDMNPGNIFIIEDKASPNKPAAEKTKVLDFGVAKILRDHTLELGMRAQTLGSIRIFAPAYGAPEQFDDRVGEVGPWTDIYGFSLMLLESMVGEPVTHGEHIGDFARGALDEERRPTPRTLGLTVPDEIEQVFVRSFKINPKERWQNATDFWVVFRNAIRMARHKGFNALSTVPLSMGFLKDQIDLGKSEHGKSAKEQQQKTLAMAAPPFALPPPPAPAPTTHRLKAPSSPGLNATLAMQQRPSGLPPQSALPAQQSALPAQQSALPAQPAQPAQGPVTNGGMPAPTNPTITDDPSARPSYEPPPEPPKSHAPLIAIIAVAAVLALLVVAGALVAFLRFRAAKVEPAPAVSVMLPSGVPSGVPGGYNVQPPSSASTAAAAASDSASPPPSAGVRTDSPTDSPTATPSATPTAQATIQPTTQPTTQVATQPTTQPTIQPHASATASAPPVDPNAFNEKAARSKLDTYGGMIGGGCHEATGLTGPGSAKVTFGPDGKITQIALDPPYAGTPQASCVQKLLAHAAAPPFVGAPVTITYKFSVAK